MVHEQHSCFGCETNSEKQNTAMLTTEVYVLFQNFLVCDNTRTGAGQPLFDTSSFKHI